ncbi:right-handed parallel beta-helix repeat-containing protein [Variovorax robiniae]|uniref:Right-handed parallel beta-helix repeat-containing protein n=1 Tax=Variovorax robiniae TaxID=1836199 RepID=A0ABU8XJI5_9BURK
MADGGTAVSTAAPADAADTKPVRAGVSSAAASAGATGQAAALEAPTTNASVTPVVAPIVIVGTGTSPASPTGAILVADLASVPWATLPAGSHVYVRPGTYGGPVTINATGSAAAPILVDAADPTRPPVVTNSIDIRGASYFAIRGLRVQSPTWGGFVIRLGSHDVTVDGNAVLGAPIGINVTDGAGTGLVISNNLIEDTATHGIAIAVNGSASTPNVVSGNIVRRSGHHGMEVRGSHWRVEHNDVSRSGLALAGTSGIHIYSAAANENSGDDNIVRYNASYSNADTGASDGNGIQLDHWCDRNTVAFNVMWNNDGPGINLFEAASNNVYGNTAAGNSVDPGGTHGALAELVVGAVTGINRASGNHVFDNLLVSIRPNVPAIYVDGRAYSTGNTVGPNLAFNAAGGPPVRWGDARMLSTAVDINSATGTQGNLVELPAFANPYAGVPAGFKLVHMPSAKGQPLSGETDFAGVTAQTGMSYFGAFFATP